MSIQCRWASQREARENGWFSRRHQTEGESKAIREAQEARHLEEARRLLKAPFNAWVRIR
jgi:FAD synthase